MIKLTRPICPHPDALINRNYKHPRNKDALRAASNDKCMYCESKISHIDFAHIEHIKPKAEDKFPDLEFDWNNLGYACPKCNNAKSDKYHREAEFIDPYSEDPSVHLYPFGAMIYSKRGSERGDITIREIELNRTELIEKRTSRLTDIQKAIDACFRTHSETLRNLAIQELLKESSADKEYSVFVRALFTANDI